MTDTPTGRRHPPAGQTPDTDTDTRTGLAGSRACRGQGWALLATSLGFAVVQLDVSVVNVAIEPIGAQLGGQIAGLQWVVNAYTVAFAASILSAGAMGDRFGAKRMFLGGFSVFTLACAACGLAANLALLNTARAVQGVGAAVLVPCSLTLLNHAYPDPGARRRAIGLWAAGASVALSAGPLVGGALTAWGTWRSIFFINVPVGAVGIALTWKYAVETPRTPGRSIDLPGQASAVLTLVALAWATISAGQHGFTPSVSAGFVLAAAAATVFVCVERTRREPMLPPRLFGSSTFAASTGIGLVINIAFYGLIFVFSLYFQTIRGYSALDTGTAFAPMTAAVLAANLLAQRITGRCGGPHTILAGTIALAVGLAGLLPVTAHSGYLTLVAQLILVGFGLGLVVPAMTAELMGCVDAHHSGLASGTLNTARQTGIVVGVALFGALAGDDLVSGLRHSLMIGIALAVTAAALTFAMSRRRQPRRVPGTSQRNPLPRAVPAPNTPNRLTR